MPIQRIMLKTLLAAAVFLQCFAGHGLCQSYQVAYPVRQPHHYTLDGKAVGTLVDITARVFAQAGLTPVFVEMPSSRILAEIRPEDSTLISLGWFKNPEREAFARFTKPIFKDSPMLAMALKKNSRRFQGKTSLAEIVEDKTLSIGLVQGWSYGSYVDGLLQNNATRVVEAPQWPQQVSMLLGERFLFLLCRESEIDTIIRASGKGPETFWIQPLSDLQTRSKRYIMCGRGVPQDVVDRLNRAIDSVCVVDP